MKFFVITDNKIYTTIIRKKNPLFSSPKKMYEKKLPINHASPYCEFNERFYLNDDGKRVLTSFVSSILFYDWCRHQQHVKKVKK